MRPTDVPAGTTPRGPDADAAAAVSSATGFGAGGSGSGVSRTGVRGCVVGRGGFRSTFGLGSGASAVGGAESGESRNSGVGAVTALASVMSRARDESVAATSAFESSRQAVVMNAAVATTNADHRAVRCTVRLTESIGPDRCLTPISSFCCEDGWRSNASLGVRLRLNRISSRCDDPRGDRHVDCPPPDFSSDLRTPLAAR